MIGLKWVVGYYCNRVNVMVKKLCRDCKKEIPYGRANRLYCNECNEQMYKHGAYRYKISDKVYVWVKGGVVVRAVVDGKDIEPIREAREVGEWASG